MNVRMGPALTAPLRLLVLFLLIDCLYAGVGPSALYNRLYGNTISLTGGVYGGGTASYVVRPYVDGYQNGVVRVGSFNTYVSR